MTSDFPAAVQAAVDHLRAAPLDERGNLPLTPKNLAAVALLASFGLFMAARPEEGDTDEPAA